MRNYNLDTEAAVLLWVWLARLTRADGTVLRIAAHDESVTVDGETFDPLPGCEIRDIEHELGPEPPSGEIGFAHSVGGTIDTTDLDRGLWDGADAKVYVVDLANLTTLGDALFTGTIETVSFDPVGGSGTFELLGPGARAESAIQEFGPMCRTDLGSGLCQKDIESMKHEGTVGTIVDRFNVTIEDLVSPPADNWFKGGVAVSDLGHVFTVTRWVQGTLTLTINLPRAQLLEEGEGITIYPGCDFTKATCKDKFNNLINMQAEPDFEVYAAGTF